MSRHAVDHLGTGPDAGLLAARLPAVLQLDRRRGRHRGAPASRGGRTRSTRSRGCRSSGSTSRNAPAAASRSSARRTRSSPTSSWTRSRSTTPRRCRPRPGKQAEEALHDTMDEVQGRVPDARRRARSRPADDGVYCCIGGRTALDIVQRGRRGRQGHRRLGQLRVERLHPGGEARTRPAPRRSTSSSPASRSSTCRAARRSREVMAGDDRPPAGLRPHPAARRPRAGRRRSTRAASTTPATAGRTTTPASSSSRSTTRTRKRGLLPLQDGLPRPGHLQRLRRHRAGTTASATRSSPATAASAAARRTSGTTARSTSTWPSFPGFGIETTADKVGAGGRRGHGRRHRGPRRRHQHPQAQADQRRDRRERATPAASETREGQLMANRIVVDPDHPHRRAPAHRSRGEGRQGRRRLQLRARWCAASRSS